MKRFFEITAYVFFISLIPFSIAAGQEKKNEKKVKIIIADDSGTKVVLDTLLKDGSTQDTIRLKDGTVVFTGNYNDETIIKSGEGDEHFFVTLSSDGKNTKKEVKEITIMSTGISWEGKRGDGKIYVYNKSESPEGGSGEHHKVITWSEKDGKSQGEEVIVINDRKVTGKEGSGSFSYTIKSDPSAEKGADYEKTKYVITKDGMVITIEGDDYAKVKEMAKEIGSRLDVKNDITEKKRVKKK